MDEREPPAGRSELVPDGSVPVERLKSRLGVVKVGDEPRDGGLGQTWRDEAARFRAEVATSARVPWIF